MSWEMEPEPEPGRTPDAPGPVYGARQEGRVSWGGSSSGRLIWDAPAEPSVEWDTRDWVPGQIIASFDRSDDAAHSALERLSAMAGVERLDTLSERLIRLELDTDRESYTDAVLLAVPEGEEFTWVTQLFSEYAKAARRSRDAGPMSLQAGPNGIYRVSATAYASNLSRPSFGHQYVSLIGAGQLADTSHTEVAILDSGIDLSAFTNLRAVNFVHEGQSADDDTGHGTVVASIIRELAPDARLHVCKVAEHDHAREWDILAALRFPPTVQVVNISIALPVKDVVCPSCGTHPRYTRSLVFERDLARIADSGQQPFVVAAAGNDSAAELAYPARFGACIAAGSVTSSKRLSGFSNHGTKAHNGAAHQNRFVLPGGETGDLEYVREDTASGKRWAGTSFSAAYASGILLNLLGAKHPNRPLNADVLHHLRTHADASSPDYASATHGHGIMQLSYLT